MKSIPSCVIAIIKSTIYDTKGFVLVFTKILNAYIKFKH